MSVEQNKAAIRRTMEEVWSKGNLSLIPELFTADFVAHSQRGPGIKGQDGFRQMVENTRKGFPDYQCTIDSLVAEGDKVVCLYTATGTNSGPYAGAPATGKKLSTKALFITTMRDGKSAETWAFQDVLFSYSQLGMAPPGYEFSNNK
jgi:steroid delta-isomerase-like uncharacterized protein